MSDKQTEYRKLVAARNTCDLCQGAKGLVNPSRCADGQYDSKEIGPWSRWQGDLNARVMVVARDWGDEASFERQKGVDINGPTNSMLCELLGEAGLHAELPSCGDVPHGGLFFTNAVLCLKQGSPQDEPPPEYFKNCSKFLRCQIDIIQPKLVLSLGQIAYRAVLGAYGRSPCEGPHRTAVEGQPVRLPDGGPLVVAMYDCSPRSLNMNRRLAEQRQDWRRVGTILRDLGLTES